MSRDDRRPLTAGERKKLEKQRKKAVKDAQKYHKEMEKEQKKSSAKQNTKKKSDKKSHSKIEQKINEAPKNQRENLTREQLYIKDSEEKIRNMKPKAYDDGYYIDEFGEREKQKRRVKEIREQEKEVVKRRKKPLTSKQIKRRRIFASVITCCVVLIIGLALCLTVLFKTEKIEVEGDEYYGKDQITAFSNVSLQQNIFLASMFSTPEEIVDNLPFVEDAKVEFSIPDTITIKITDAVPSYVIKNNSKYLLISGKGRILEEIDENTDNLPELTSDDLKSTEKGDYVSFTDKNVPSVLEQITTSLRENNIEGVTGFDVKNTAMIKIIYDNRITIIIGLPEDIDYKIRTAMSIITEKLDPNNSGNVTGTLDVSSCNTTKVSRYNPNETMATTAPSTAATEETTAATEPETTLDYGTNTYTDGYDYGTDTYSDGYDYSADSDTYSDNGYSDGYYGDTYDYSYE